MRNDSGDAYKLSAAQFQQIAAVVVDKYEQIFGRDEGDQDLTLKDMLIAIFVAQDIAANNVRPLWQKQLEDQARRDMQNQGEHINHLDENQIVGISNKDIKIVSRLIDLKNEQHQKLAHMMLKYDLLLEKVKKLRENQTTRESQLNLLKSQNIAHLTQLAKLKNENAHLKDSLAKATDNLARFDEESRNTKKLFDETKRMIAETYTQMQTKFAQATKLIVLKYGIFIEGLKKQLERMFFAKETLRSSSQHRIQKLDNTIKQLITDLSVAINFQRKEDEYDDEWLAHYRNYKLAKQRQERVELGRPRAQISQASSETDEFINSRKDFLKKFQSRARPQEPVRR